MFHDFDDFDTPSYFEPHVRPEDYFEKSLRGKCGKPCKKSPCPKCYKTFAYKLDLQPRGKDESESLFKLLCHTIWYRKDADDNREEVGFCIPKTAKEILDCVLNEYMFELSEPFKDRILNHLETTFPKLFNSENRE